MVPRWANHDEPCDYANHPDGNPDVGNRAMQDFYTTFTARHYDTGEHAVSGVLVVENGQYTGTAVAGSVEYRQRSCREFDKCRFVDSHDHDFNR